MPPFRIANLSPAQLGAVARLEEHLGMTLIAWEPHYELNQGTLDRAVSRTGDRVDWEAGDDSALAALNETYEVGEFGDGYLYH